MSHWIQDPEVGGGRIIGEGCHFVDLASALANSNVSQVSTMGVVKQAKSAVLNDNVTISLAFENGSVANIIYTADGSPALEKEYIEVHGGGRSAIIKDFKSADFYAKDLTKTQKKLGSQNKGQKPMLSAWVNGLKSGTPCVDYECLMTTSLATVLAVESIMIGGPIAVDISLARTATSD